jgi:hypothetical protein
VANEAKAKVAAVAKSFELLAKMVCLVGTIDEMGTLDRNVVYSDCRCFGSDRAPGVTPQGASRSRTVLLTVARWFMLGAREIVDNDVQVRAALRYVTPYVLTRVLYVMGYKGVL